LDAVRESQQPALARPACKYGLSNNWISSEALPDYAGTRKNGKPAAADTQATNSSRV
jgi:hypothetical protein